MKHESGQWKDMSFRKKLQYILDYYKLPVFVCCILLYILFYTIAGRLGKRDSVLCLGAVNTPLSEDAALLISEEGAHSILTGLVLTEDTDTETHQYVYASRMKILASIEAKKLDIVLMDREALDAFAAQNFLLPLDRIFAADPAVMACLVSDTIILKDNHIDVLLDDSIPYQAVTREEPVALDLSGSVPAAEGSIPSPCYLGIISNSPRTEEAAQYIRRVFFP